MKYIISTILSLILLSGSAQKSDTVKNKFAPTGLRLGTDLISLIRTQADDSFSGYEFNADVDLYRYFLAVDIGRWERKFSGDEAYNNNGNYVRVGADVNFLLKDPDRNMFFIGARYGWSAYSEQLSVVTVDPVWGTSTNVYNNFDVKANWFELTTGLRVKMWKYFWMGYTARYKFGLNTNTPNDLISHDIPGYGKTTNPSTWGFNYQVLFRIPIRKQE